MSKMFYEPNTEKMGKIQVILGPMFSGKTTELIRRIKRYQYANYRCLIVRYAKDDRYDSERVCTHDQQKLRAVSAVELTRLAPLAKDVDVIAVDEGQFFPDIVSFAESMANARKIVLVAALDGTFQRTGFCDILRLIPLAESVEKLTAVCMSCFRDAAFTKRLGQETEVELIGGQEKYMAVCRECHKLEAPVRRSPFKSLTNTEPSPFKSLSTNQNTGSDQAPPPKDVADKKRKLFEEEPKDSSVPPIKSLRQTQV